MSTQAKTNSRSLLSSVQFRLIDAWRSQQEIERKRQRLGRIRLPTLWFQAAWATLFAMRMILLFFLAALSFGYWFMSSPILENTRKAYNLPGSSSLLGISGCAGVGAAVYTSQLVQMVQFSIKQKRLAFRPRQPTVHSIVLEAQRRKPASIVRSVWLRSRFVYKEIFGPKGLMGIEHPYFLQFLILREIAEILSQGYQAYASSTMVPRRWINNFTTTLLVLNCWSTHLVQALGPKSLIAQRVLCLAVDTVLDFGWTVVIPVCIALPYILAYDSKLRAYPDHLLADNGWQLNWQMDIQQLCITSWLDFISTMLPCVSMLASSRSIAGILDEKRTLIQPERSLPPLSKQETLKQIEAATKLVSVEVLQTSVMAPSPSSLSRLWNSFASLRFSSQNRTKARVGTTSKVSRRSKTRLKLDSHFLLLFLLGVCVTCVHVYATVVANRVSFDAGCLVQMRPWFARSYACAYANINCLTDRTGNPNGNDALSDEAEITERLSAFHPSALRYLVISHCSALKIPAIVRSFRNLQMVEIYNSTIVEWKTTAAFTIHSHPFLRRFGLIRTNLSALPDALVQDAPFVFVNLIATNLTTLPDSILSNWRALQYFNMEHGQLREIPRALTAMNTLQRLSVCDNQIEALPKTLPGAYSVLNVARNPLRTLPESLHDSSHLRIVSFEHTLVESVPSWLTDAMAARASLSVYGTGSPFCEQQQRQIVPASSSPTPFGTTTTECARPSRYIDGHYSLALVSRFLALPSPSV